MTTPAATAALARFTTVSLDSDCWTWEGRTDRKGYGIVSVPGIRSPRRAHRIAYEAEYGPIPAGAFVLHRCDNPPCVNPAHLYVGTHAENMADMRHKGRSLTGDRNPMRRHPEARPRGEDHGSVKLTEEQVAEIRALRGVVSQRTLAARFGVHCSTIWRVQTGRIWSHV